MNRWKKTLLGSYDKPGVLKTMGIYFLLVLFGFSFLYPIFHMLMIAFKSESDLINPLIVNLPTSLYPGNFQKAVEVLKYWQTLGQTLLVSVIPTLIQVVSCSLIAYGFAKFRFPCKKLLLGLVLLTFIIPPQVTMIPQFIQYSNLHLTGSLLTYIIPAMFGQGRNSAVVIFVYYMFISMIPKPMEEAAKIDGASSFKIYIYFVLPLTIPATIISLLLSFVWYYNETTLATLFFGDVMSTLLINLNKFASQASGDEAANEAVYMAGTFLSILPMLVVFAFSQHFFIESVDKAGITGE